jgi:hypothetical protein
VQNNVRKTCFRRIAKIVNNKAIKMTEKQIYQAKKTRFSVGWLRASFRGSDRNI